MFSRRFSQKTAESKKFPVFFPVSRELWFLAGPKSCSRRAAEEPTVGNRACSKNTHHARGRHARPRSRAGDGVTDGGSDSVVFGRRLSAKTRRSTSRLQVFGVIESLVADCGDLDRIGLGEIFDTQLAA